MKTELPVVRQLFNVKEFATAGLAPDAIPEGQLGIIDDSTNQTVLPSNFANLPKDFRFISKLNGEVYYSLDTIQKDFIEDINFQAYKAPQVQKWKTVIESCDCIHSTILNIHLEDEKLLKETGFNWTQRDLVVEVAPEEFKCFCDCTGKGVYEQNVMTMLLYKNIKEKKSPFYDVEVKVEGGSVLNDFEAIKTFVSNNKAVNTDDDKSNDGKKLELYIVGKSQDMSVYKDIELGYVRTRGVKLTPSLEVNGVKNVEFELVQELAFERNNGVDLRAEEADNITYYTNVLNHVDFENFQNPELVYQFENGVNYDVVNFNFSTKKKNVDTKYDRGSMSVLLGAKTGSGAATKLKAIFTT